MYPLSLQTLIEQFRRLPGVGEKTAERYALVIADLPEEEARNFADALISVKTRLHRCPVCGNLTDEEECDVCRDKERDRGLIFVVQSPRDVTAMERTGEYQGLYHVLNGLISSSKGILPEDLNIDKLEDAIIDYYDELGGGASEGLLITNSRHYTKFLKASKKLALALDALDNDLGTEVCASALRACLDEIGEVTGKTVSATLADTIFSRFCIGK